MTRVLRLLPLIVLLLGSSALAKETAQASAVVGTGVLAATGK